MRLTPVNSDLVIVAAVHGLPVHLLRWERLEAVVVGPLLERHVFASVLDDLLSNEASKHGCLRCDRAGAVGGNFLDDVLINLINKE